MGSVGLVRLLSMAAAVRARGPSVRDMIRGPSPVSPRSPLWVEGGHDDYDDPPPLDLDCGSKQSIARSVATSPQRYSGAFSSQARCHRRIALRTLMRSPHTCASPQVPRFAGSAYYRANDPRGIGAKERGTQRFYNAPQQQPHIGVKDPARQHVVFRSSVERFPEDMPSFEARGLHPQMKKAQPSFATGDSMHLQADKSHWTRTGFFHPRGPRLPPTPRQLTADLQSSDMEGAGEHIDGMQLSLAQTVQVSPRKLRVMSSRSDRFTTPHTYGANEPRNVLAIRPPYENELGPGSYDAATGAIVVTRPEKPQCNFASGSPRLPKDRPTTSVGTNTSSVELDNRARLSPRVWTSKAHFGRHASGAQVGSFEGLEGLGRSTSPERRSPDVTYSLDHSVQKRPLGEEVSSSKQRYSPAFRSQSPRLLMSRDEKRSLSYPTDATDQFDLSASAAAKSANLTLSGFSLATSIGDGTSLSARCSSAFASESQRFPLIPPPQGSDVDLVDADRRKWHSSGQPLTTRSERFPNGSWESGEASPGPGTYINPREWKREWGDARQPMSPASPTSPMVEVNKRF